MPTRFTPDELAEARRLCDAATPGPWNHDANWFDVTSGGTALSSGAWRFCHVKSPNDGDLIAASRTLIPRLLDEVAALQQERDEARSEVAAIKARSEDALREAMSFHNRASEELIEKPLQKERDEARELADEIAVFNIKLGQGCDRLRAAADRLAETVGAVIANNGAWARFSYMTGEMRDALAAYREATKP